MIDFIIVYSWGCLITATSVMVIQVVALYNDVKKYGKRRILYILKDNWVITLGLSLFSWIGLVFILATLLGVLVDYIKDKIKNL